MSTLLKLKSFKPLSIALAAVVCAGLVAPTNAMDITPSKQLNPSEPVSAYFNQTEALRAILNWQSAVGWGSVGTSSNVLTLGMTENARNGGVTKERVITVCGTSAAAAFGNWKPVENQTTAPNMKAVFLTRPVIGSVKVCDWMTQGVFTSINGYVTLGRASIISGLTGGYFPTDNQRALDLQNQLIASYTNYISAERNASAAIMQYANCLGKPGGNATTCSGAKQFYLNFSAAATNELFNLKSIGSNFTTELNYVNLDIGTTKWFPGDPRFGSD